MNKEDWQEPYINRVLEYHNKKYGRNMTNLVRCEEIHPELKGKLNWDWSALDKNNGDEVAIEVKRLNNPPLQEKYSLLDQILRELSDEMSKMSNKLKGTFILSMQISEEYRFNLHGDNKQKLKDTLKKLIKKEAQNLEVKKERNLSQALKRLLPDIVPNNCHCVLSKFDDEGSLLSWSISSSWWAPNVLLEGEDLIEFRKLFQTANRQLAITKTKGISDTFLILLEIDFSGADANVLQRTLQGFEPGDYNHIRFLYLVNSKIQELFFKKQ